MNLSTKKEKERQAYNYACRILTRKDYTTYELKTKLKKKEYTNEIIEKIIQQFIDLNFLNDKSYAERYIRTRLKLNPRSKAILKLELQRKGISTYLLEDILSTMEIDDFNTAKDFISSKQIQLNRIDPEKRHKKVLNLLKSRGFNYGIIVKITNKYY